MKIKYSALVGGTSGSLGGSTASHNRYGAYLRQKVTPVNPNSSFQLAARSIFRNVSTLWATLSAANRAAWETYALQTPIQGKDGTPVVLTGQAMFVRCNSGRLAGGLTVISAGPTIMGLPSFTPPVVTLTAAATSTSIAFTTTAGSDDWAREVGGAMLFFFGRTQPPSRNWFGGPYRYAGKIVGAVSPPTSPSTTIVLPFVAGATGSKLYGMVRVVRADGRLSDPAKFPNVV